MTYRITFVIEAPSWAPTGWEKAIVEHHYSADGAVTGTRRADIDDWIGHMRRDLGRRVWQEVSGHVMSTEVAVVE